MRRMNRSIRHHAAAGSLALLALALGACGNDSAVPAATAAPSAAAPAAATAPASSRAASLKLATWNLEWLIAPEALRSLRANCVPRGASPGRRERFIPCDVATDLDRSGTDFAALARYAQRLDADVIALQEVDGPAAARRVFPDHQFCFTSRKHVQNTGFAIRRGLPFRCGEFQPLSLNGRVRRGAELVLFPGEPRELHLLSVHLKSGCGRRTLDSGRDQCAVLAMQVPELERWIDARAARGLPFAVLGDFNRDLLDDRGPARAASGALRSLWAEIDDADPPEADLTLAAEGQRFTNCAPNQNYGSFIDHIALSRTLAERRVPGSFERVVYDPADALRLKLADHCPVAISVRLVP
jgi:endonuclease/exonuclease/phosphatase family metal-dependent hydrolase